MNGVGRGPDGAPKNGSILRRSRYADAIIFGAAGFFALLLVYSIARGAPIEYPIVLGVVCGLSLLSLRLSHRSKLNLSLVLVSTGLTLLSADLILEFTDRSYPTLSEAARNAGATFDSRSLPEVVKDLRLDGTDAYPIAFFGFRSGALGIGEGPVYPLAGISNVVTVTCNESGEWMNYLSDEHGFNNPKGIWEQDRIDIAVIGDSFINGLCVVPDRTIPGLIREVHPSSLSLGMVSSGPLVQLAIMKEYLGDLKPKTVLWFFLETNDIDDLIHTDRTFQNNAELRKYTETNHRQDLISKQSLIDQELRMVVDQRLSLADQTNTLKARWIAPLPAKVITLSKLRQRLVILTKNSFKACSVSPEVFTLFERTFRDGAEYVNSWGGRLYFVYLPGWERYAGLQMGLGCIHDKTVAIARSAGATVIDLTLTFDAHPDPLSLFPFRLRAHYNEAGYKLAADTVLDSVKREQ